MRIGLSELIVIVIFAIIVVKPDKIPEYAQKFALVMQKMRESKQELDNTLQPAEEMKKAVTKVVEDTVLTESEPHPTQSIEERKEGI